MWWISHEISPKQEADGPGARICIALGVLLAHGRTQAQVAVLVRPSYPYMDGIATRQLLAVTRRLRSRVQVFVTEIVGSLDPGEPVWGGRTNR